ncbi:MAG: hypothetical protein EGMGGAKC_00313 [Dehalococcoides mccartyi]|nr:hypothetical protein [Dehalococcoides mccartyi]
MMVWFTGSKVGVISAAMTKATTIQILRLEASHLGDTTPSLASTIITKGVSNISPKAMSILVTTFI